MYTKSSPIVSGLGLPSTMTLKTITHSVSKPSKLHLQLHQVGLEDWEEHLLETVRGQQLVKRFSYCFFFID